MTFEEISRAPLNTQCWNHRLPRYLAALAKVGVWEPSRQTENLLFKNLWPRRVIFSSSSEGSFMPGGELCPPFSDKGN